jgi:hypothetical protein
LSDTLSLLAFGFRRMEVRRVCARSSASRFRPRFERGQTRFGLSDELPETGFGARVLGKAQNSPHPHDTMAEPSHFIFNFGGHGVVGIARAYRRRSRPLEAPQENVAGTTWLPPRRTQGFAEDDVNRGAGFDMTESVGSGAVGF